MINTLDKSIRPELQKFVKEDKMPMTLAHVLSPMELGKLWLVHPSDNDPVVMSSTMGAVAIFFTF